MHSPRDRYLNYRPNPNLIPIPSTAPPPFRPIVTNKRSGTLFAIHQHIAFVDKNGDGTTDVVDSHYHRVMGGRVLPDESDGHTHKLTGLPAGAG